jgi:expansin (peptidoglycan-binding protein)
MAVVTVKSKAITNRDASPRVINDSAYVDAQIRQFIGAATITNTDSVGSKFILGQIPSNALIHSLLLNAPDIGTTTAADIGLYRVTAEGGAVVDADFFKAAQALNAGPYSDIEVANANIVTLANSEKRVYELLGLTLDPNIKYDVVLTLTGAADATGAVQLKCQYAV